MRKVYPDTYYIEVYEDFKKKNGEPSEYTRMAGDGSIRLELVERGIVDTKKEILSHIKDKRISRYFNLKDFVTKETEYGWVFERYVKWLDEDGLEYEIVTKDEEYDDYERYVIDLHLYETVWCPMKNLK